MHKKLKNWTQVDPSSPNDDQVQIPGSGVDSRPNTAATAGMSAISMGSDGMVRDIDYNNKPYFYNTGTQEMIYEDPRVS